MAESAKQQALDENNLGLEAIHEGRIEEALDHFARATALDPSLVVAHIAYANTLMQLGQTEKAIRAINDTVDAFPDDFSALFGKGLLLVSIGELDEGITALDAAAAVMPDIPEFYLALGDAYMTAEENERGIHMFRRALELRPDSDEAHFLLGRALMTIGQLEEALPELEHAAQGLPHDGQVQFALGATLSGLGRWEEAIAFLMRSIALEPDFPQAYISLAMAYLQIGRKKDALAAIKQAEQHAGDDPDILFGLAQFSLAQGRHEEARAMLERVIALDPEDSQARMLLASIAMEQGDVIAGINQLSYVQQHDPEYIKELEKAHGPLPSLNIAHELSAESKAPAPSRARKTTPPSAGPTGRVYQLKITLRGSKPPIWRRIQVPGDITLGKLHDVIQVTMGWQDQHLHAFEIGGVSYADKAASIENTKNETRAKLHQVADEKSKFSYVYDFGDDWQHDILVEKVLPPEVGKHYPVCLTGKRAAPLEDSGGLWGYYNMLEILQDPDDPEYDEMLEWAGGPIDPEHFDCAEVNEEFTRMKL